MIIGCQQKFKIKKVTGDRNGETEQNCRPKDAKNSYEIDINIIHWLYSQISYFLFTLSHLCTRRKTFAIIISCLTTQNEKITF